MSRSASEASPASRPFSLKDLSILSWGLFIVLLAAPTAYLAISSIPKEHVLQQVPERNFIFRYIMGRMLNDYPANQLYNFELQKKVATEFHPLDRGREYTPNPHPPFVGILFQPFARLPYFSAYLLWLAISGCLYIAGLRMVARRFFQADPVRRSLVFPPALAFFPFIWTMYAGQLSAIGFFVFALALSEDDLGHDLRSGLALSLCLYKPSLLLLFLPMLIVSRRFRTLAGFAAGGAVLFLFTVAVHGMAVWSGYLHFLFDFGSAAASAHGYRILQNYIDLVSFSSLLRGGRSWAGGAILIAVAGWALVAVVMSWIKSKPAQKEANDLMWAATLTWTCVLNLYVPIYDSLIVVPGVIATAAVLQRRAGKRLRVQFTILWILILVSSWIEVQVARAAGFEILTVLFALLGTLQLAALRRVRSSAGQQAI